MIRHHTASAIVFDGHDLVLLVHHNKMGKRIYPGGHMEPGEDPAQAAIREVREETGVHAAVIAQPAFTHPAIMTHPAPWVILEGNVTDPVVGPHRHIDHLYVLRAESGSDLTAQLEEISAARWVAVDDVRQMKTPAELPALIEQAARWARNQLGQTNPSVSDVAGYADLER